MRRIVGLVTALVAGTVLVVNLFLTWFAVDDERFDPASGNAFDFGLAIIGSLVVILGVVALVDVVRNPEVRSPYLRFAPVALIAAGTAVLLVQLVVGHDLDGLVDYSRRIGVYLGPIAGVIALAGSALACFGSSLPLGYVPPPPQDDAA